MARLSGELATRRVRQLVQSAVPAAGADPSLVVPGGHAYRVMAVYAELISSAVVANRAPVLTLTDGVARYLSIPAVAAQTAGLTWRYTWAPHVDARQVATSTVIAIPELVLAPGFALALVTGALDAGDQWTALRAFVEDTTYGTGPIDLQDMLGDVLGAFGATVPEG